MEPGYYKCKHCNDKDYIVNNDSVEIKFCYYCGGSGQIDWIENIVGKRLNAELNKWYSLGISYNDNKITYIQDGIIVSKEKFIADVKIKEKEKEFGISFHINLNGCIDDMKMIGGSV